MYNSIILSDFHIMAKPAGAKCNLNCTYCFYKHKKVLYPQSNSFMTRIVMENYIRQVLSVKCNCRASISWQGGEPMLMGLDFFKRAIDFEKSHNNHGLIVENTIQTNGILIDEQWCKFFHENKFLVGISIDGPLGYHDTFRKDKRGNSVFNKITRSVKLMQKHDVDFNILCTVNSLNSEYPMEVYRFFRDELQVHYIQFIPIVECESKCSESDPIIVTRETVSARQYGNFLISIFDEWVKKDVGTMFIQLFDGVLASYVYGRSSLCIFQPSCGRSLIMEHNGDLYSCDHFVDMKHLLGNIGKRSMIDLVNSQKQQQFGLMKSGNLSTHCKECEFLFTCFGECPKNRIIISPDKQKENWLCDGLKLFFTHTKEAMHFMTDYIKQGKTADIIMTSN